MLLIDCFHLNLLQIASVLTVWNYCADCSYIFLAATVFTIGHFQEQDDCDGSVGHSLLKLACSIYNIQHKINRYTNNTATCFHSKSNFEHLVYLCIFLYSGAMYTILQNLVQNQIQNNLQFSIGNIYKASQENICTLWWAWPHTLVSIRICPGLGENISCFAWEKL